MKKLLFFGIVATVLSSCNSCSTSKHVADTQNEITIDSVVSYETLNEINKESINAVLYYKTKFDSLTYLYENNRLKHQSDSLQYIDVERNYNTLLERNESLTKEVTNLRNALEHQNNMIKKHGIK